METLRRTMLYDLHRSLGASMGPYAGWDMPLRYPAGAQAEHLATRRGCGVVDISHMSRFLIQGPDRAAFLQRVLSCDVARHTPGLAQYAILSTDTGGARDDAYLYEFTPGIFLLVGNAAVVGETFAYLSERAAGFDCTVTDATDTMCAVAVQGPESENILRRLTGIGCVTAPQRGAMNTLTVEGRRLWLARTGYTGESYNHELYLPAEDGLWLWQRLMELGATPTGMEARESLRTEACLPHFGCELGLAPDDSEIPVFASPMAFRAVSFSQEKGDYVGRSALLRQSRELTPRRIMPIALLDPGVLIPGSSLWREGRAVGYVTSAAWAPYFVDTDTVARRWVGLAYLDRVLETHDVVRLHSGDSLLRAAVTPRHIQGGAPFVHPVVYTGKE
jgi:aminomethyltransferase